MSEEKKDGRSLACRIKDDVDAALAKGDFEVKHGYYYSTPLMRRRHKALGIDHKGGLAEGNVDLPCGCAIGIVQHAIGGTDPIKEGAIAFIQAKYPEITEDDILQMEAAFEGWDHTNELHFEARGTINPDSEFYKLGKYIAGYAK